MLVKGLLLLRLIQVILKTTLNPVGCNNHLQFVSVKHGKKVNYGTVTVTKIWVQGDLKQKNYLKTIKCKIPS